MQRHYKLSSSPELSVSSKYIQRKLVGGKEIEYMNRYFPESNRNKNSMSLYSSKDKAENVFTQKIKAVIENDPSLKNMTYSDITKHRLDNFKPEGYVYFDFLLKHPLLLDKTKNAKLPKITERRIKSPSNECSPRDIDLNNVPHMLPLSSPRENSKNISNQNENNLQIKSPNIESITHRSRNYNNDDENKIKFFNLDLKSYPSQRYKSSDIHNLSQEKVLLNRSGETYLFKPELNKDKISFSTSTQSTRGWIPKISEQPTLLNHGSVQYNILTPNYKSISFTKPEIKELSNERYYKIGSMSQFVDLTRVSSPNLNPVYMKSMSQYQSPFNQHSNVGANYSDMHRNYKGLFKNSFWSKSP